MDFSNNKAPSKGVSEPNLPNIEEEGEGEGEEEGEKENPDETDSIPAVIGGDPTEDLTRVQEDPLRREIANLIEIISLKEARGLAKRKRKRLTT